jgi:predicted alpha/beta superfamily hydrolase
MDEDFELLDALVYSWPEQGSVFTTAPIRIPNIDGERPLTIYLPPDYEFNPEQYYPVAYLFDGQNLYEPEGEWPAGWQLHHVLDTRAAEGLTVPIVVGIHHGPNRDEELCPWPAEPGQTPRANDLLRWIREDLHPLVNSSLRLLEGPENTVLGGSSLGGMLAMYGCFEHSDFFGGAIAMSPSLWVGEGAMYDYISGVSELANIDVLRLYIDCGALEGEEEMETEDEPFIDWDTDPLEDAEAMVALLEAKGLIDGEHFLWINDPEGQHNEYHWGKRLPIALQFLYD